MEQSTSTVIVLKELAGNPLPQLNALQRFLAPHIELLTALWVSVWIMTVIVLVVKLLYEYKKHKAEK